MFPLQLYGSVGPEEDNDPEDVAKVSNALTGLGLAGARDAAQSGAWDNRLGDTVKSFQESNGLDVDGVLLPDGPTQAAINRSLEEQRSTTSIPALEITSDSLGRPVEERDFNAPRRTAPPEAVASAVFAPAERLPFLDASFADTRREPDANRSSAGWWRRDPELPRIGDRASKAIAEGTRQREVQFNNFLKALGPPESTSSQAVESEPLRSPSSDEVDRILTARGYRYVPDPMGRIGWGDWVDGDGKRLDPAEQQAIVARERPSPSISPARAQPSQDNAARASQFVASFAQSELGARLAETLNRLKKAVGEDGAVPSAIWQDELRKIGIEAGQIGARSSGVTLVTHPGDKEPPSAEERMPRSFLGRAWSWLTEEFPGLAEEKARAIDRLDAEIRAIEAEPRWRRNPLNLIARQSLLEARTGIIGGFPTSRLDFALAGIDVIGVAMVSGRPLLILRKGSKIITSADLAEGGFRSRQALDLGKDVPYNSHTIRALLEQRFGAGKVTSTTVPAADYHLIQLAGKRHPVTGIVFNNKGYPIFDDIAKFDTRIPSEAFWKASEETHKRYATIQLREAIHAGRVDARQFGPAQLDAIAKGDPTIPGFRWHHHEDPGRMQLVPAQIHEDTRHLGGLGLRKGK